MAYERVIQGPGGRPIRVTETRQNASGDAIGDEMTQTTCGDQNGAPEATSEATEPYTVGIQLTQRERAILIAAINPAYEHAVKLVDQLGSTVAMAQAMMNAVATPGEVKEILGFNNAEMEKKMVLVRQLAKDYQAIKSRLETMG